MIIRRYGLMVALVLALLAGSCASGTEGDPSASDIVADGATSFRADATAEEFVGVVSKDIAVMFDPFLTPDEAVEASDLVIEGRIVRANPGATVTRPNKMPPCVAQIKAAREAGDAIEDCTEPDATDILHIFIDLSVEVSTVVVGDGVAPGDVVSIQVEVAPISIGEALKAVPSTDVLVLAVDESDWQPDGQLEIPGKKGGDAFYVPYSQGFWLLGSDQKAVGLHAETDSLSEGWGEPETFEDMVSLVAR